MRPTGSFGAGFSFPVVGVEQVQDAQALLVRLERDRLAVGGEGEALHVPRDVRREVGVLPGREVEVGEALELGVPVGGDVDALAVGAPAGPRVGDLLRAALGREQGLLAGRDVHHPDVALVDRDALDHEELRVVRRPVGRAPAAALDLEDAARRGGVLRVDDVDVAVGAVAAGRAEGHPVPGVRPRAQVVLRAAAVRDHRDRAGGDVEAEDLAELVAAPVLVEDEVVGRAAGPARAAHAVGEERQLPARAARRPHLVDLRRVAEARADEHLALRRVPAGEARGAELGVAADRLGDLGREVGEAVDDQVVGRLMNAGFAGAVATACAAGGAAGPREDRGRGGRRGAGVGSWDHLWRHAENSTFDDRTGMTTQPSTMARALARARRRPWSGESASTSSQGTQRISCSSARSGDTAAPSGATTR